METEVREDQKFGLGELLRREGELLKRVGRAKRAKIDEANFCPNFSQRKKIGPPYPCVSPSDGCTPATRDARRAVSGQQGAELAVRVAQWTPVPSHAAKEPNR